MNARLTFQLSGLIPFALNANSICSLQTDNGKQVTCYVHHPWVNAPVYNKKDTVLLEKPHGHVISSSGINSICTKCIFPPFQSFQGTPPYLKAAKRLASTLLRLIPSAQKVISLSSVWRTVCYSKNWNSCTQEIIFLWNMK